MATEATRKGMRWALIALFCSPLARGLRAPSRAALSRREASARVPRVCAMGRADDMDYSSADARGLARDGAKDLRSPVDFYGRSRSTLRDEADADEDRRHRSVVKIFSVTCRPKCALAPRPARGPHAPRRAAHALPRATRRRRAAPLRSYELPWQSHPPESSTGSGLAIRDGGLNMILTNAHVVSDATLIEVRKSGSARRFVARAHAVAHECDLAVLTIDDADFWAAIRPLELGGVPHLRDGVVVVGFPEGGDSLCVTSGVVSRIELQPYEHSGASLLALQIDAAINPGNSGGPAFDASGRVVGVAFQNAPDAQSIGFVIPTPIIRHFLKDIRANQGAPIGFPSIGIVCQHTENPQLRARLGLPKQGGGILVRGVHPLAAQAGAERSLQPDDVLLEISGVEIASDGTCEVNAQERVSFAHVVQMKFPGESCDIRLLRGGQELRLAVPVMKLQRLVPDAVERAPCYFIYGGVVFMPLTMGFLHEYGEDWYEDAPRELVALWEHGVMSEEGEQPVVLSRILAAKETAGYGALAEKRVLSVNGERVRNFRHLFLAVRAAGASGAPYVELSLQSAGGDAVLVIGTAAAASVDETVRRTYRIPQLMSEGARRARLGRARPCARVRPARRLTAKRPRLRGPPPVCPRRPQTWWRWWRASNRAKRRPARQ